MKKYLAILSILLFIAASSYGFHLVGSGQDAGGGGSGEIGTTETDGYTKAALDQYVYYSTATPTAAGSVRYGHLYVSDSDGNTIAVRLYDSSGNGLLCCTGTIADDTPGWINCDAGGSYTLEAETTYWYGIQGAGTIETDNEGSSVFYYNTSWTGGGCPDPILQISQTGTTQTGSLTIVWNNSPGDPN